MARRYFSIERKDTDEHAYMAEEMHRITKAYQYQHGYASEFEALVSLLTSLSKKRGKEKEEREEKKTELGGSRGRTGGRGGRSGAADFPESEAVRNGK